MKLPLLVSKQTWMRKKYTRARNRQGKERSKVGGEEERRKVRVDEERQKYTRARKRVGKERRKLGGKEEGKECVRMKEKRR